MEPCDLLREVERPCIDAERAVPVNGVFVKERRGPDGACLLAGINKRRSLLEEDKGKPVPQRLLLRNQKPRAQSVMIFQKTQLVIIVRVHRFLPVQRLCVCRERLLAGQIPVEIPVNVIFVADVERAENLRIRRAGYPASSVVQNKRRLHRLREPDAARPHFFKFRSCLHPEFDRDHRRDVAPEAIHISCPDLQRFDLIVPERPVVIIEVDHIPPVACFVSERAVLLMEKPLRMLLCKNRVRRCVVVNHVDNDFHALFVNVIRKIHKIFH